MPNQITGQPGGPQLYDYAQLERLWIDAGGPPAEASRAAATALAESAGNPLAQYPAKTIKPGQGSWNKATGLWQILGKPPGSWKTSQLTDPFENAKMAVAKYKAAGGWGPWQGDDWRAYYQTGVEPAAIVPGVNPPGGGTGKNLPYTSPFGGQYTPGRIDQGVDFSGSGPIRAIGKGRVLYAGTGNTGWGPPQGAAPGGFVRYELEEGPAKGRQIYVAEGLQPSVHAGQQVQEGQTIGQMVAPIETGWASGVGTQPLSQTPAAGGIGGAGPFPTKVGQSFDRFLVSTGVKPSADISGSPGSGQLPSWLNVFNEAIAGLTGSGPSSFNQGGNGVGGLSGIAGAITGVGDALGKIAAAVDWFLQPSNEIRLLSGISGGILVLGGIWMMSHAGGTLPGAGENAVPRPMALPLGMLMTGIGAILLFVALHNLPAGVNNFSDLIGHLTQSAQTGSYG